MEMAAIMLVNLIMVSLRGKGHVITPMEIYIKEVGKIIALKARV